MIKKLMAITLVLLIALSFNAITPTNATTLQQEATQSVDKTKDAASNVKDGVMDAGNKVTASVRECSK